MTRTSTGQIVLLAALGMMAGLMATEVRELDSWAAITSPSFVGSLLAHFASIVAAYVSGQIVPTAERFKSND